MKEQNAFQEVWTLVVSVVLLLVLTSSCGGNHLRVRLANETDVDFETVEVKFPSGEIVTYYRVRGGDLTAFKTVFDAYSVAELTATAAAGQTYQIVYTDLVGEDQLATGDYSYVLAMEDEELSMSTAGINRADGWQFTCEDDSGNFFLEGESFPEDDGCNVGTCRDGKLRTTLMACYFP